MSQPKNNPVFDFDQSAQIEIWLREQWAGLFREMLRSRSQQKQLSALTEQISELKAVNGTLKNYLEVVVKKVDPAESVQIIDKEDKRIEERRVHSQIIFNDLFTYIKGRSGISDSDLRRAFEVSKSFSDLCDIVEASTGETSSFMRSLASSSLAIGDANEIRDVLGLKRFEIEKHTGEESVRRRPKPRKTSGPGEE
jgi:hypothetical protein